MLILCKHIFTQLITVIVFRVLCFTFVPTIIFVKVGVSAFKRWFTSQLWNETFHFAISSQIKNESFLEDVNNILNSGDVPNLYAADEQERILTAMKPVVQDLGQQPTKANLMAAYIKRVRSNIHTVLCMRSALGILSVQTFFLHW